MGTLLERIKVTNPQLAERIEWSLADAIAKAQAKAKYEAERKEQAA
jgi:hypothetical protein